MNRGDVPGGPVVKTLHLHCRGQGVRSLVRELRSHMPAWCGPPQKNSLEYVWLIFLSLKLSLKECSLITFI